MAVELDLFDIIPGLACTVCAIIACFVMFYMAHLLTGEWDAYWHGYFSAKLPWWVHTIWYLDLLSDNDKKQGPHDLENQLCASNSFDDHKFVDIPLDDLPPRPRPAKTRRAQSDSAFFTKTMRKQSEDERALRLSGVEEDTEGAQDKEHKDPEEDEAVEGSAAVRKTRFTVV